MALEPEITRKTWKDFVCIDRHNAIYFVGDTREEPILGLDGTGSDISMIETHLESAKEIVITNNFGDKDSTFFIDDEDYSHYIAWI